MPAQHRDFFQGRRIPQTKGLVDGTGGETLAVGAVRQHLHRARVADQGAGDLTCRRFPEVDGTSILVHNGDVIARRADNRP